LLLAATAVLGGMWIAWSATPASMTSAGAIPSPRAGFAAPDFDLELLSGSQVSLRNLRGKALIVNLWASWCPPCRAEMPALQEIYLANRARGLEVLAVNMTYQDSREAAAAFVAEHGLDFPIGLDLTSDLARRYQLRALPSTFFVDRQGIIRQVIIGGPMSAATIQAAVEKILEAQP
jgi:peroxiredoxin